MISGPCAHARFGPAHTATRTASGPQGLNSKPLSLFSIKKPPCFAERTFGKKETSAKAQQFRDQEFLHKFFRSTEIQNCEQLMVPRGEKLENFNSCNKSEFCNSFFATQLTTHN